MCYRVGMQDLKDIGEVKMSLSATHPLMLVIIGA